MRWRESDRGQVLIKPLINFYGTVTVHNLLF